MQAAELVFLEGWIWLNQRFPAQWNKIKFQVRYKNIWFSIILSQAELRLTVMPVKGVAAQS
jgi:hypothetical protein